MLISLLCDGFCVNDGVKVGKIGGEGCRNGFKSVED